jgi:hypothetical protein
MPAKRLVVVSAACLRHLRFLLGARVRHVCTAVEATVRLGVHRRPELHILGYVQYSNTGLPYL